MSMHKMILPKRTSKFVTRMARQPPCRRDPRPNTMRKANFKQNDSARDTVEFNDAARRLSITARLILLTVAIGFVSKLVHDSMAIELNSFYKTSNNFLSVRT